MLLERGRGPGQGLQDATLLSSAPRTAFWHTPSVGGRPVSLRIYKEEVPPVLPLLCPSLTAKMPSGGGWGCGETPAAHQAGGLTVGTGDRSRYQANKPVWIDEEKSHHCAGENKGFSDGFKIWSDFYLEPESSWLVAEKMECWTG